ncbi:MAG: hypothetical protein GY765_04160, partial [bacterium]|nr:hypothetical protein [bacterium]
MTKNKKTLIVIIAGLALTAIFLFYSTYRQKYVGACDWYGYYSQSQLLKAGKLYMETELDPKVYPSVAPLGYYAREGKVVPHFPPGLPLVMALFGTVGLEFYVLPLFGVLSVLMLFLVIRRLTDAFIAAAFALMWALSPMVVWGSTILMSDLPATFFILWVFYLILEKKLPAAALVLGFSLLVRPNNILFLPVLLPLLIKGKHTARFFLFFSIGAAASGIYNWLVHGLPWKYGYYSTLSLFSGAGFFEQLWYYGKETFVQVTPLLLVFAGAAFWKRRKESLIYALWYCVFLLFYCFIWLGGAQWGYWGLRFLLPALPALYIAAALGVRVVTDSPTLGKRIKWAVKPGIVFVAMLTLMVSVYYTVFTSRTSIFIQERGKLFHGFAVEVGKHVPQDSVVGAFELTGPLRLYADLESFNLWYCKSSMKLMKRMVKRRPLYIIREPLLEGSLFFQTKLKRFEYTEIETGGRRDLFQLIRIDRFISRKEMREKHASGGPATR